MCKVQSTQAHLQATQITQVLCTRTLTQGPMDTLAQSIVKAFSYRHEDAHAHTHWGL